MRFKYKKVLILCIAIGVISVGLTAMAIDENVDGTTQAVGENSDETIWREEEDIIETTQAANEDETANTQAVADTDKQDSSGAKENILSEGIDGQEESDTGETVVTEDESNSDKIEKEEIILQNAGIIYYLNQRQNQSLADIYNEIDVLLKEKVEIYKTMYNEGEITYLYVKQIEALEAESLAQVEICKNESIYYQTYLIQNGIHYDDIEIKKEKSLGDINSCIDTYPDKNAVSLARYVTDCNNAIIKIEAKKVELESLEAVRDSVVLLKGSGEASRIDVIDSEVSVLKAKLELESYYYDMNIAYYSVVYDSEK